MKASISRRSLLASGLVTAAVASVKPLPMLADETTKKSPPNRIGVSTYSYWRFRDDSKLSIEECIDLAADAGFDGVEILHIQMQDESNGSLAANQAAGLSFGNGPVWLLNAPNLRFARS